MEVKQWLKDSSIQVCGQIEKSRNEEAFHQRRDSHSEKNSQIPIHLQKRIEKELKKPMNQNQIIKLNKDSDRKFISPIVITTKEDQTVKLAMESKKINKSIHKNKYQMPNIDLRLYKIAQLVNFDKSQQTMFSLRLISGHLFTNFV